MSFNLTPQTPAVRWGLQTLDTGDEDNTSQPTARAAPTFDTGVCIKLACLAVYRLK